MYMRTGIRQSMNLTLLHVPRRDLPVHQRCRLSRELAVCAMSLPRLVLLTILPRTPGSLRWGSNIVVARSRCCNSCECRGSSVAAHHHHCCGLRSGPQFLLMVSIVLVVVVVLVRVGLVSICGRRKVLVLVPRVLALVPGILVVLAVVIDIVVLVVFVLVEDIAR
ncbi:hypothetical protein CPB85DRAFT_975275 [Mucidula mucida]|nr:hypothetical protein CPB85DRAFT_975275 [Mucidula mucida]